MEADAILASLDPEAIEVSMKPERVQAKMKPERIEEKMKPERIEGKSGDGAPRVSLVLDLDFSTMDEATSFSSRLLTTAMKADRPFAVELRDDGFVVGLSNG